VVAELPHYVRGREPDDLIARLCAGAEDAGAVDVAVEPDELHALEVMLERSNALDVIGVTALGQRPEIFGRLDELGAVPADPDTVAELVRRARR
jgi:hypothetical protein